MTPSTAVESEQKPVEVSHFRTGYHVGDPIPNGLTAGELRRVLNLAESTFYAYQKAGKFKRFEFRRPVSYTRRYSGALVKRYLENDAQ